GLPVRFHRGGSIALEEPERSPRVIVHLTFAVSLAGPGLVEVEHSPFAHEIHANELERPKGDVAKILSRQGLAQSEQCDGRFAVPCGDLVAVHSRLARAAPFLP